MQVVNVIAVVMGMTLARELAHDKGAQHAWWLGPLIAAITASAIVLPFHSFLTERLRPYFRRYLDERGSDIRQAM